VPAILSGLANLASKPNGGRQIADAIARQPSNLLENLAGMISGSGQLANIGNTALTTLFGSSTLGALASVLGRFGGIGEGAARTLLGMVTPLILGVLGRQTGGGVRALTQSLSSQKDQFAGAIPPGLSDLLKTSGINFERLGTVSAAQLRTTDTHREAGENVGSAAYARSSLRPSQSSARWAYWAIPALVLAGLFWYLLGERTHEPVARGPSQAFQPTAQVPGVDSDLQRQITAALDTLNGTLQGVKDAASAGQGLPRLQQVASELDRLSATADRLPVETRDRIAEAIKATAARLRTTFDNVTAMPGVGVDVKPLVAALRTKVDALAQTPGSLAQQRVIYLARTPSGGGVLASAYFDQGMHNRTGEKIGSISDLIVASDGTIAAALVGVGGFLGIGEKEVAVPFSSIEVVRNANDLRFVIDATKEALKEAPSFEDTAARVHLRPTPSTNR
jgi:Bacterial protein of unknown function (DUF937)/PRC-barrel domain